jgi:hypothetical protein
VPLRFLRNSRNTEGVGRPVGSWMTGTAFQGRQSLEDMTGDDFQNHSPSTLSRKPSEDNMLSNSSPSVRIANDEPRPPAPRPAIAPASASLQVVQHGSPRGIHQPGDVPKIGEGQHHAYVPPAFATPGRDVGAGAVGDGDAVGDATVDKPNGVDKSPLEMLEDTLRAAGVSVREKAKERSKENAKQRRLEEKTKRDDERIATGKGAGKGKGTAPRPEAKANAGGRGNGSPSEATAKAGKTRTTSEVLKRPSVYNSGGVNKKPSAAPPAGDWPDEIDMSDMTSKDNIKETDYKNAYASRAYKHASKRALANGFSNAVSAAFARHIRLRACETWDAQGF